MCTERVGRQCDVIDFTQPDLIRVFETEPDLLAGLDRPTAEHLRRRVVVRGIWADPGPWSLDLPAAELREHLGLLVVRGVFIRTLRLSGRESSEVIGPGDIVRPWESDEVDRSVQGANSWLALQPAVLASLDRQFAATISQWPSINAQLMARGTRRCGALVHQAAISRVRRARMRVLLVLWHLADRWGRVTPDGVVVPVPLTHQLLSQLTCLARPTVSAAVAQLGRQGELARLAEGGWMLRGQPPGASADVDDRMLAAAC